MQPIEPECARIRPDDRPLQPLRISAGWRVVFNNFYEIHPEELALIDGSPDDEMWALFEEDMLHLRHEAFGLGIDLGWYPAGNPSGKFVLQLIRDKNWAEPVELVKSRNVTDIITRIDYWLKASRRGAFGTGDNTSRRTDASSSTGPNKRS